MNSTVTTWVVPTSAHVDLGCLNATERGAASALGTPAARARHLRSRAVLRHAVASATGMAAKEVALVAPPGSPPVVSRPRAPGLSLAHAGGVVAVALCRDGPVGIDVEVMGSRGRPVPSSVLSRARLAAVADLVEDEFAPLAVWVVLEAVLKAAGTGFGFPQHALGFVPVAGGVELDFQGMAVHRCVVRVLPDGVLLAVATPRTLPTVRLGDRPKGKVMAKAGAVPDGAVGDPPPP